MSPDVLGKPQDRLDGRLKVTGRLRYSGDRPIENVAFGYLVTSTIARGEIRAMDVSEAERSTGVVAVFTPFHSLKLYDGLTQVEGANSGEIDSPQCRWRPRVEPGEIGTTKTSRSTECWR